MSDGREEREDQKTRFEQEKRNRPDERPDRDDVIDWEPERADS